jgi:hypothetical protein
MIIIKEEDTVITHFGVQGMRWGIRKERYQQNREKAKNILKKQSNNKRMNVNDLKSAEWMSKSVTDKISNTFFREAINSVIPKLIYEGPDSLKDPKDISKFALLVAERTAKKAIVKEAIFSASLRRYDQSGEKDFSKKQYKKHSLTPEKAVMNGILLGMNVAPIVKKYSPVVMSTLVNKQRKRKENIDARMKSWGPNLLDKKISEFHTTYDDGYLSVLERIKSDHL